MVPRKRGAFGFAPISRMKAPSMGKVFRQAMSARDQVLRERALMGAESRRVLSAEERELIAYMKQSKEYAQAEEFEMKNAQRAYELEEKKFAKEAKQKIVNLFRSELSPIMAELLSRALIEKIGYEAIREMDAEQLKQVLIQSPTLKEIIFKLKAGKRTNMREMNEAAEEIQEILEQVQQQ